MHKIIGVDVGLANIGVTILECDDNGHDRHYTPLLIKSKRNNDNQIHLDDMRRYLDNWISFKQIVLKHKPTAIAYENFQPRPGAENNVNGYKALVFQGYIIAIADIKNIPVYCYLPAEVKRHVGAGKSGSQDSDKQVVIDYVQHHNLIDLTKFNKTTFEHLADSVCISELCLENILLQEDLNNE